MFSAILIELALLAMAVWFVAKARPAASLFPANRPWFWAGGTLVIFYLTYRMVHDFYLAWEAGFWLHQYHEGLLVMDFTAFHAAARLAILNSPLAPYDWPTLREAIGTYAAQDVNFNLGFFHPPMFLLLILPMALVPFTTAAIGWLTYTGTLFFLACSAIWQHRRLGLLLAIASPVNPLVLGMAQTGFLIAGLFGLALVALPTYPVLAGIFFGMLIIKPQFGILIPIALIASRQWRAFGSACATVLCFGILTALAFGWEVFPRFLEALHHAGDGVLLSGALAWQKFQSVYGLARWSGLSETVALSLQAAIALSVSIVIGCVWRSPASHAFKAAALCVGALIVTPYCFLYDFPLVTLALLFLLQEGESKPLQRVELAVMAVIYTLPCLMYVDVKGFGYAMLALLMGLIIRRWRNTRQATAIQSRGNSPSQSEARRP